MKTRVLDRHHVSRIVAEVGRDALMDEMIAELTNAIAGLDDQATVVRARDGFRYERPDVGLVEWMPVLADGGQVTIKVVGYHPTNPSRRSLPTIVATVSVYDTVTGHLTGLVDGTFLTALRTGAASAVASRVLARPDAGTLGLVGCGAQAVTQLHAMARTFDVERVLVHDIDPATAASFRERAAGLVPDGTPIELASLEDLLASSDIVCTQTSIAAGGGPLFDHADVRPWLHINAIGSDLPGKTELPRSLLTRALVCPDHLEQALAEGECQQLDPGEIGPSLDQVVVDADRYRSARDRLTVFDSTGWAVEDHVAAQMLFRHANRMGLGILLEVESLGGDPKDPYDLGSPVLAATRWSPPAAAEGA